MCVCVCVCVCVSFCVSDFEDGWLFDFVLLISFRIWFFFPSPLFIRVCGRLAGSGETVPALHRCRGRGR